MKATTAAYSTLLRSSTLLSKQLYEKFKMAGSKRMSQEEKRKTILDIYHKSKEVFTEKEICALATKAGVNAGT